MKLAQPFIRQSHIKVGRLKAQMIQSLGVHNQG